MCVHAVDMHTSLALPLIVYGSFLMHLTCCQFEWLAKLLNCFDLAAFIVVWLLRHLFVLS